MFEGIGLISYFKGDDTDTRIIIFGTIRLDLLDFLSGVYRGSGCKINQIKMKG